MMDFKFTGRLGKVWRTDSLGNTLKELGVKTLQDAIEKEREKIRLNGLPPTLTAQPEPSKVKYAPPYDKPRLPYKDDTE